VPLLPGTPPTSTRTSSQATWLDIINLRCGYAYSRTSLPSPESFTLYTSAQDSEQNMLFDADMLPHEGTSTGWFTICFVEKLQTFLWKTQTAY
jgi:hypothetical protein